jgi:hypothetical protein
VERAASSRYISPTSISVETPLSWSSLNFEQSNCRRDELGKRLTREAIWTLQVGVRFFPDIAEPTNEQTNWMFRLALSIEKKDEEGNDWT